jgi:hypothetical protein
MPSYSVEAPWYSDTDAIDHITNDLERLAIREKYQGKEQIQTPGGSGMLIRHVGHSMIHTPTRALHLRHILHAPQATKHLLYVHHFTRDNNIFLNIIRIISLSRTQPRRSLFFMVDALVDSTCCHFMT